MVLGSAECSKPSLLFTICPPSLTSLPPIAAVAAVILVTGLSLITPVETKQVKLMLLCCFFILHFTRGILQGHSILHWSLFRRIKAFIYRSNKYMWLVCATLPPPSSPPFSSYDFLLTKSSWSSYDALVQNIKNLLRYRAGSCINIYCDRKPYI